MAFTSKIFELPYGQQGLVTVYGVILQRSTNFYLDYTNGEFTVAPFNFFFPATEHSTLKGLYQIIESRTAWDSGEYLCVWYNQTGLGGPNPSADLMLGTTPLNITGDSLQVSAAVGVAQSTSGSGVTLLDYITDVQRLLHDSSYQFTSQQELTDYINRARKIIAAESDCTRQLVIININAASTIAEATYSMDSLVTGRRVSNVMDIILNYSSNTVYPLKYLPFSSMVRTGLWQAQYPGTPSYYTINNRQIFIVQWPAIAYNNSTWDLSVEPLNLVNTTDIDQDVPFPYSECVGFYAAYLAKLKDQRRPEAEEFLKDYQREKLRAIGITINRRLRN